MPIWRLFISSDLSASRVFEFLQQVYCLFTFHETEEPLLSASCSLHPNINLFKRSIKLCWLYVHLITIIITIKLVIITIQLRAHNIVIICSILKPTGTNQQR